jgi:hypothetical protein
MKFQGFKTTSFCYISLQTISYNRREQIIIISWQQILQIIKRIAKRTANLKSRFSSSLPIFECFTIFDLLNLPDRGSPEFKTYGSPSLKKLANHFVQSDTEEDKQMKEEKMTAEWGHLKYQLIGKLNENLDFRLAVNALM